MLCFGALLILNEPKRVKPMWALLNQPEMMPFLIATILLLMFLCVEVVGFFLGSFNSFLDGLLPDALLDADVDVATETDVSMGVKFLDWLYFGRMPTMILLILWLASFAIMGLVIQQVALSFLGHYLPTYLASFDALVVSILALKALAVLIYPILPKDESTAISANTLIGHSAKIVMGYAKIGEPAQAKLIDKYGQSHYVMVEPDPNACQRIESLSEQDELIITKKVGEVFLVKTLPKI